MCAYKIVLVALAYNIFSPVTEIFDKKIMEISW